MIPAYIIHHKDCLDRKHLVDDLVRKTNGTVVDAVWCADGKEGCRKSHLKVAALAKQEHPHSPYLVFEDDCILTDCWRDMIEKYVRTPGHCELVFLGFNDICEHSIFGTHAILIFPEARQAILDWTEYYADKVFNPGAFDIILSKLITKHHLLYAMPPKVDCKKYAYQCPGLTSTITGNVR